MCSSDLFNFLPPTKISEGIMASAMEIVLSSSEDVKRIYYLVRCRMLYEAVERIESLEANVRGRGFCNRSCTKSLIGYGVWAFWVLVISTAVLQLLDIAFGNAVDVIMAMVHFTSLIWKASNVFSTVLLIGLGQKLLACYDGVAAEFLTKFGEARTTAWVTSAGGQTPTGPANLAQLFQETQQCFTLFNKVVGPILLVSVFESSILSVVSPYIGVYYSTNWVWTVEVLLLGLCFALRVILIACMGQTVEDLVS